MSASREKKRRQNDPAQGLTQKQRKGLQEQQAAKRKTILYTVIGVIVAVLVVILLVWHSGIFQRRTTAVSVGGRDYNVTDVEYYYRTALVNEYYMSYYTGSSASFDPQGDLTTQYVDADQTQSYHDYFLEQAMENLTEIAALENAADEAGYSMTDEEKADVQEQIDSMRQSAEQSGYTYEGYLKANYGKYMTPSAYKACLEREARVNGFYSDKSDSLEYTDEEIQAYYDEHADDLDTFQYRYLFFDGSVPETTDEEGNTVEPTEEETAVAMEAAKAQADAFVDALNAAEDKDAAFAELAPNYVDEEDKDSYTENPDQTLYTTVGSNLASSYGSWLKDASRQAGDVEVLENSTGDGYFVVLFLNRSLDETPTVDVRHILVLADLTQEDDPDTEDVDESTVPTQEALDAAKAEAEDLLAQWESGDKTAESFGELANANSDDPGSNTNGGLYEKVYEGEMFGAFNDWIFDPARQSGDTTLIENTQSGQQGWHVVYFQGQNDPVWMGTATDTMRNEDMVTWLNDLTEGLEATQASGIQYVG